MDPVKRFEEAARALARAGAVVGNAFAEAFAPITAEAARRARAQDGLIVSGSGDDSAPASPEPGPGYRDLNDSELLRLAASALEVATAPELADELKPLIETLRDRAAQFAAVGD